MPLGGVQHRPLSGLQKANQPGVTGQSSVSWSLGSSSIHGDQHGLVTVR